MQRIIALAAAAAAAGVVATTAPASAQTEQRSVRVSYADLDLTSPAGRRALDRRIDAAVDRICQDRSLLEFVRVRLARACRAGAMASVQPQLSTLYRGGGLEQASVEVGLPVAP